MNWVACETLQKLMKMRSDVFTVEELKYLIGLSTPYPLSYEKNVEAIYKRVSIPEGCEGFEGLLRS